ncbi:MAG: hypothetical protein HQK51_19365 [Oligoflexia bacterium]|nr:hypothetical protein [Oligoflexia bacterium]
MKNLNQCSPSLLIVLSITILLSFFTVFLSLSTTANARMCQPAGGYCNRDLICCLGTCEDNRCAPGVDFREMRGCVAEGSHCMSNLDCCSNECEKFSEDSSSGICL